MRFRHHLSLITSRFSLLMTPPFTLELGFAAKLIWLCDANCLFSSPYILVCGPILEVPLIMTLAISPLDGW